MLTAHYLVVPFRPSQFDLDTLPHLSEVIDQAKSFNEELKPFGLLTLAPTNPSVSEVQQANDYLADFPLFTALSSVIHDRKVYRDVTAEGKGVVESNNPKAIEEFEAFMKELLV